MKGEVFMKNNIIHCKDCAHCFKCQRSNTGYSCEIFGHDDFACGIPLDGYCHNSKPKNFNENENIRN